MAERHKQPTRDLQIQQAILEGQTPPNTMKPDGTFVPSTQTD